MKAIGVKLNDIEIWVFETDLRTKTFFEDYLLLSTSFVSALIVLLDLTLLLFFRDRSHRKTERPVNLFVHPCLSIAWRERETLAVDAGTWSENSRYDNVIMLLVTWDKQQDLKANTGQELERDAVVTRSLFSVFCTTACKNAWYQMHVPEHRLKIQLKISPWREKTRMWRSFDVYAIAFSSLSLIRSNGLWK